MKENLPLRFLYRTALGRSFLKLLIMPGFTKTAGGFLNTRASKVLIKRFMKKNHISLKEIDVPQGGFSSFNEFFKRKRKAEFLTFDREKDHLISPCDALLSYLEIDEESRFTIKNTEYSLASLLRERKLAKEFQGGLLLVFRLTPTHYHRYSFVDSGRKIFSKRIKGVLHCVRPIAMENFPVFIENSREYIVLDSENFGRLVQMEVGALIVGKIKNRKTSEQVVRGEEKGTFEFGGSTIIVLLKKDAAVLDCGILRKLKDAEEIEVRLGERIGKKKI